MEHFFLHFKHNDSFPVTLGRLPEKGEKSRTPRRVDKFTTHCRNLLGVGNTPQTFLLPWCRNAVLSDSTPNVRSTQKVAPHYGTIAILCIFVFVGQA